MTWQKRSKMRCRRTTSNHCATLLVAAAECKAIMERRRLLKDNISKVRTESKKRQVKKMESQPYLFIVVVLDFFVVIETMTSMDEGKHHASRYHGCCMGG